jgi:putative glycerol-1-phosphate prenyltransferase
MTGSIETYVTEKIKENHCLLFLLFDPDHISEHGLPDEEALLIPDIILVGGSFLNKGSTTDTIRALKAMCQAPVILFPGGAHQLSSNADAVLFLSLVSGRNPRWLVEEHVSAAPFIHHNKLETIPTGYLLIDSGTQTTVNFISQTTPLPRDISRLFFHALLQYLGMRMLYLEAGSRAKLSVPPEYIRLASTHLDIPVITGGGLKTPEDVRTAKENGASGVVIGTAFEKNSDIALLKEMKLALLEL